MLERILICAICLAVANFGWEAFTQHAWMVATERSYFQDLALVIFWWVNRDRIKFN